MKKLSLLCPGILYACMLSAQPSFQTSLQAGISLPLNSNDVNGTHLGKAIHFGNHLDYSFGNRFRFGLGAYVGFLNALSTDNKYRQVGAAIAEKYRFAPSQLSFNSESFKSTHILLGPVASFGAGSFNVNFWAKGGYAINEASRYAVLYKEGNIVNNVYVNQKGDNSNGLAYNIGAGVRWALSDYVGMQLSAGYFSTQTDQVNYNFDREKGTAAAYSTAANQFIQASAGIQFSIGKPAKRSAAFNAAQADTGGPVNARMDQKIKTKSNIKNDRVVNTGEDGGIAGRMDQKIKTKSNIKNDRLVNNNADNDNDGTDSLFFSPEKLELRSVVASSGNRTQLQAVDNYLTGFVYRSANGAQISQCGSNAMPGDPVPGIDVKLKRLGGAGNDVLATRTNKDGSFAFNNIAPGDYSAEADGSTMNVTVAGDDQAPFRTMDMEGSSCSNTTENYIIQAGDKTYVEVIPREAATGMASGKKHVGNVKYEDLAVNGGREAGSGMATGRRMHKPYRVSGTDFDISTSTIYKYDGKLYAEVLASREAGSGMATGRRNTIVTGDIDGDGIDEYSVVSPRDAASGMATGRRMHKPYVITKELDTRNYEVTTPRDAASGMASGRRMHKPYVITVEADADDDAAMLDRDAASGMATGKRMHKPYVITKELDARSYEVTTPRDAASGMATGRRMHKPFVVTITDEDDDDAMLERDAASGMATGKRMHKPLLIRIYPDDDSYEVVSPRDAASGLATGKRVHKPFVITKELNMTDDGEDLTTYHIVHRDLAARNVLLTEKTIVTGKDNDNGMFTDDDVIITKNPMFQAKGTSGVNPLATAYTAAADNGNTVNNSMIADNPLYEDSGAKGVNPLFEAKEQLLVMGSNGIEHAIYLPGQFSVAGKAGNTDGVETYALAPIKWMAPEAMAARKSINEKGIKRSEAAKGITEKGIKKTMPDNQEANAERKGWDGTVKGGSKGITQSGVNATGNETGRKGWDGSVKGGRLQNISRVRCADGTCAIEGIVNVDGVDYEAVVYGALKTRHETAKNSISNVR